MNNYQKRFQKFLLEQDEAEITDRDAMASTLDKGTSPEDFDVDAPKGVVGQAPAELTAFQKQMFDELRNWLGQMENFKEFLNGTDSESIQTKLNSASPETLFKKISDAETKKISRVAMELGSLIEIMKGYLAGAADSKYKGQ
jgi:hypothetical protein